MAETEAPAVTSTPAKKSRPKKAKSAAPQHPKVSEMVNEAIDSLRERGGSSLQAIKKYVAANYKVDIERLSPFLKKYLRSAVVSGALVQTKGKGATGSFKMGGPAAKPATAKPKRAAPPKEKPVAKRSPKPKTIKKPAPKKLKAKASPKKAKAAAVKPKAVKSKKPAAKKSPAKKAKK